MKLTMNPQPSRMLPAMSKDGITQVSYVRGFPVGSSALKIRWKVSYLVRGEFVEEVGENSSIYL
jgi:hypothetical protein